jgi:hypothetical protein
MTPSPAFLQVTVMDVAIPKYEHVVVLTLLCIELYALKSVVLVIVIILSCKKTWKSSYTYKCGI